MVRGQSGKDVSTWAAVTVHGGRLYLSGVLLLINLLRRIMDLARDFPRCEAVAVDLVPMDSL